VLRKGIKFSGLILDLSMPTRRLVMDGRSSGPITARSFMLGVHVADAAVALATRSEFAFPAPVDRIEFSGDGFLVGLVPQPVAAGLDPKEPVEISATLFGIAYVATPLPAPPSALEVVTLGDPARTARAGAPDANRGFEASWLPPLAIDATGRDSVPAVAAPAMLRKLTRPPAPTSPPVTVPQGPRFTVLRTVRRAVTARVLGPPRTRRAARRRSDP
jgi:hypothetical protein